MGFLMAKMGKESPAMWGDPMFHPGQERSWKMKLSSCSCLGESHEQKARGLQFVGLQRRLNTTRAASTFTFFHD